MNRIKRATMTDVARKAGVSQTTVSFVLNGIDAGLPERTKQKVMDAAKDLNYSPNDAARRLASKRSHSIGLAIYDIASIANCGQVAAVVLASVYRAAERRSYKLAIYTTHERQESGEDVETYFAVPIRSHEVEGMVVWDNYADADRLIAGFREGLPIVTLDRHVQEVPAVVPDYSAGFMQVLDALVAKGHSRFCLLNYSTKTYRDIKVREIFGSVVQNAGLPQESVIYREQYPPDRGKENVLTPVVDELLAMPDRPTAIMCAYDRSALSLLVELRKRGVRVPEDVAVVGCAGLPMASYEGLSLSTLDLRHDLIASHAVDLVVRMAKGENLAGTCVVVQPEFIQRSTC